MPQPKNQTLRLLIPTIVIVVGFAVAYSVFMSTRPKGQTTPTPAQTTAQTPGQTPTQTPGQTPGETPAPSTSPAAATPANPTPAEAAAQTPAVTPAPVPAASVTGYHVVPVVAGAMPGLGDLDPKGAYRLRVEFSEAGAGIKSLEMAQHFETIEEQKHVDVQQVRTVRRLSSTDGTLTIAATVVDGEVAAAQVNGHEFPKTRVQMGADAVELLAEDGTVFKSLSIQGATPDALIPFGALAVEVTPAGGKGVIVPLAGAGLWQPIAGHPGRFEATIADDAGTAVLRLTREYSLAEHSLEIGLAQKVENLSSAPLSVKWYEAGPTDLPQDAMGYGGDKRRVRFGYLLSPQKDPTRGEVQSSEYLTPRATVLDKREPVVGPDGKPLTDAAGQPLVSFKDKVQWPNAKSIDNAYELVWAGATNRYFGVAVHPINLASPTGKVLDWAEKVERVVLDGGVGFEIMALRLESRTMTLAPGASADLSHGIFAGPLDRGDIGKDPLLSGFGLAGLVVYNFGGPCAFCTFAPISDGLLWILHTLHDRVFHDWSLSIVFLVLIVRSCLHPVTKWSQIRMARFGKQMAGIAPKQKILQEKYKDDPKKLQEETGKLWREQGISPTGFLGCLPMVLQTPVWIALYASLYFSVEMRNEHAFYGVFQHIQSHGWFTWQFLGNLAEPDRLMYWGKKVINLPFIGRWEPHLPLLGDITGLNVLPLLLAVVFFIQQKYLTPPTTATMTPEQEFQQKLMRWMTVFMFPIFMYNAPSGLAIYFICNSTFAIIESKYIRSHVAKLDAAKAASGGSNVIDRKQKKQGFMARLQEMAEEKQKEALKQARRTGKGPRK